MLIFSFLSPSVLDLGSETVQTDRQTDYTASMHNAPAPYEGGNITRLSKTAYCILANTTVKLFGMFPAIYNISDAAIAIIAAGRYKLKCTC